MVSKSTRDKVYFTPRESIIKPIVLCTNKLQKNTQNQSTLTK